MGKPEEVPLKAAWYYLVLEKNPKYHMYAAMEAQGK